MIDREYQVCRRWVLDSDYNYNYNFTNTTTSNSCKSSEVLALHLLVSKPALARPIPMEMELPPVLLLAGVMAMLDRGREHLLAARLLGVPATTIARMKAAHRVVLRRLHLVVQLLGPAIVTVPAKTTIETAETTTTLAAEIVAITAMAAAPLSLLLFLSLLLGNRHLERNRPILEDMLPMGTWLPRGWAEHLLDCLHRLPVPWAPHLPVFPVLVHLFNSMLMPLPLHRLRLERHHRHRPGISHHHHLLLVLR